MRSTSRLAGMALPIIGAAALAACDGSSTVHPPDERPEWEWSDLGGPAGATPALVSDHETLVVAGSMLLIGTEDGVWRRPLEGAADWERAGLEGRAVHALAKTTSGRIVAAGYDPRDERAPTAWYSATAGADWIAAAVWPRGAAGTSYRFASLEPDPQDADVLYGGLDADTLAVTVDGGASWFMTGGASSPNFGYPCVAYRPRAASVILQGCELPLDVAWVGARDVSIDNRFTLANFRFLFGYPDMREIGNRRINAIAGVSGRDDRVLVGVEGGLLELTSTDGRWSARETIESRVIYRSDGESTHRPYAYMRAIAPLSTSGRAVLFGGTINGKNAQLSLFETSNGGLTVRLVPSPMDFEDPRVEQAVMLGGRDVLLVISDVDAQDRRRPHVYRLHRP